jgi:hypothetical protein
MTKSGKKFHPKRGELTELKEMVKAADAKRNAKTNYRKFNFGRKS